MEEIFESAIRSAGDIAGVFEFDGEISYFYLYSTGANKGEKVLDSILITTDVPDFKESDVAIKWDAEENKVGLVINGSLWAVFDLDRSKKFGGGYKHGVLPDIPNFVAQAFGKCGVEPKFDPL